jgi:hypothetical protein
MYEYFNSLEYLNKPILYDPVKNVTYPSFQPCALFVSYFNTTGILQHNDICPQYHPTDMGQVKLVNHLIQFIQLKFGWVLFYMQLDQKFNMTLYIRMACKITRS